MSPVTHFFAGWLIAASADLASPGSLTRRDKALIVAAAVAPDVDGLGIIPEYLTRHSSHPLLWFSQYHHALHSLAFALVCAAVAFLIAGPMRGFAFGPAIRGRQLPSHPWLTSLLVFLSFHLHLLCDLAGSRGPDGDQWPIPYLKPFSNALQLTWHGQWALNGWQNFVITGVLLVATLWIAWRYGSSPVELVSGTWNGKFVKVVRVRFKLKSTSAPGDS
jgi:hypothetical protein